MHKEARKNMHKRHVRKDMHEKSRIKRRIMLHYFVQLNFATILICFFMIIFVNANPVFPRKVVRMFSVATILIVCLVIADSVEYWCSKQPYFTNWRVAASICGYALRPTNICFVILLSCGDRVSGKFKKLIAVPGVLNALVVATALFSGICFSYTEQNEFVRGPLGYITFVISAFYLVLLVVMTRKFYQTEHTSEHLIAIFIAVANTVAVILESFLHYDGLINVTGAVSIAFYYMYLTTQQFKRDPLTHALNRRYFYLDADNMVQNKCLTAVVSIDLNDLKVFNDKHGHAAGDEALCTIVSCIQKALLKGCHLYRTGGDEFMILCSRCLEDDIQFMIADIREKILRTPYRCAIGYAAQREDTDFEQLCALADAAMYADKKKLKSGGEIR